MRRGETLRLTHSEVFTAAMMGSVRRYRALMLGAKDQNKKKGFDWNQEIESCCAEVALASRLRIYIDPFRGVGPGDVGPHEVKHTKHTDDIHLIVAPDRLLDDKFYFLFSGQHPNMIFRGSLIGSKVGNRPITVTADDRQGYWVPEAELGDWEEEDADLLVAPRR